MHAFAPLARHPLFAFAVTVLLALASMALMLWIDNAAQLADCLPMLDLFGLLDPPSVSG